MPPALSDNDMSDDEIANGIKPHAPTAVESDVKAKDQMKDELMDDIEATSGAKKAASERKRVSPTNSNEPEKGDATGDDDEDDEDEEEAYEVEAIINHEWRKKKGKNQPYVLLYNVKWKGYPESDNTLEPEENLIGSRDVLAKYQHSIGGVPQPPNDSLKKSESSRSLRDADDSMASDTPPSKRQKRSKQADPEADEDSGSFGEWQPKANANWDKQIKTIETVERDEKTKDLVIYVRWNNGKGSKVKNNLVREKAPQALINFYERHLNFAMPA